MNNPRDMSWTPYLFHDKTLHFLWTNGTYYNRAVAPDKNPKFCRGEADESSIENTNHDQR